MFEVRLSSEKASGCSVTDGGISGHVRGPEQPGSISSTIVKKYHPDSLYIGSLQLMFRIGFLGKLR
jgi:hypothetical protein